MNFTEKLLNNEKITYKDYYDILNEKEYYYNRYREELKWNLHFIDIMFILGIISTISIGYNISFLIEYIL